MLQLQAPSFVATPCAEVVIENGQLNPALVTYIEVGCVL
jgi:hypothetical protein